MVSNIFSEFLAGELDSTRVHFWLLSASFVAEILVGMGILLESKFKTCKERAAAVLIMGGIIAGFAATFSLFIFDEAVSGRQQSTIVVQQSNIRDQNDKIIALEQRLADRTISPKDRAKIIREMLLYKGTPVVFGAFQEPEAEELMEQISSVLLSAEWVEHEWKSGGDIVLTRAPPHPIAGVTNVRGVYVQADGSLHVADFGPIVRELAKLLTDAGVPAKAEVGRMGTNTNNDDIKILVGQKVR